VVETIHRLTLTAQAGVESHFCPCGISDRQVCTGADSLFTFYLECKVALSVTDATQFCHETASLNSTANYENYLSTAGIWDEILRTFKYEERLPPMNKIFRTEFGRTVDARFKVDISHCDLPSIRASRIFFSIRGDTLCTTLSLSPCHSIGETLATQRTFMLPLRKWLLVTVKLSPNVDTSRPCWCAT
jgi:hypothetical protein